VPALVLRKGLSFSSVLRWALRGFGVSVWGGGTEVLRKIAGIRADVHLEKEGFVIERRTRKQA